MGHELMEWFRTGPVARVRKAHVRRESGQGTVEYVGLILLMAVLIAGVVQASSGFKDTTVADAVVKKLKTAIESVDARR